MALWCVKSTHDWDREEEGAVFDRMETIPKKEDSEPSKGMQDSVNRLQSVSGHLLIQSAVWMQFLDSTFP